MTKRWLVVGMLAASGLLAAGSVEAGITVYDKDGKSLEIGGRVQIQYLNVESDAFDSGSPLEDFEDDLFFRRLRPYIAGTVTPEWFGKVEFDFGESLDDNEVSVKDAFIRYDGWKKARGLWIEMGNIKAPYSREFNNSSNYLQMVERSFAGDHNFGAPDRTLGARVYGEAFDGNRGKEGAKPNPKLTWSVMVGQERIDPGVALLDFDSPANNLEDWNQGPLAAGRVDWHPLGYMKMNMGDFHSDSWKVTVGAGAFSWQNDDDNNTYTNSDGTAVDPNSSRQDVDNAYGFEISGGVRGHGVSADVEYHVIESDTIVEDFTGGLYDEGTTSMDILSVSAGYMIPETSLELAVAWSRLGADGYEEDWDRTTVGANWYFNEHAAKFQLNYRMNDNVFGVKDDDQDAYVAQLAFFF